MTRTEAFDAIVSLVDRGRGGSVFTPNVDHVVLAESNDDLRRAYEDASLSLADGVPILWAARLLGQPLPEKLSGSDIVLPLLRLAADRSWRVYFLGAAPGVGREAADRVRQMISVDIVGVDAPEIGQPGGSDEVVIERIRRARPHLVLVALGAPKQEIWIHRVADRIRPAVALGVGASIDFLAGRVARAPAWVSRAGLEWLFRLAREPRRLWRRYLLRDPLFLLIVGRMLIGPRTGAGPGAHVDE